MGNEAPNIELDNLLLIGTMKGTEIVTEACEYIQCSRNVQALIDTLLLLAGESRNDILGKAADSIIENMIEEEIA